MPNVRTKITRKYSNHYYVQPFAVGKCYRKYLPPGPGCPPVPVAVRDQQIQAHVRRKYRLASNYPASGGRKGWGRRHELGREEDAGELVGGVQYGCSDGERAMYLEKPQALNP